MCAQVGKMARKSDKGGRKRDFVDESFDDFVDKTNKTLRFKCLYCDTVTSQNWSRIVVQEDSEEEDKSSYDDNNNKTIIDQCSNDDNNENYDDVDNLNSCDNNQDVDEVNEVFNAILSSISLALEWMNYKTW